MDEYIYLSRKYGIRLDWFQAGGGNISVKDDDKIYVKKSGTAVCDAEYVLCDLFLLNERFHEPEEDLSQVALTEGMPSIEVWFHTFTKKYTVHLHPTELCSHLCQRPFTIHTPYRSLVIPYFKPGKELAQAIQLIYQEEPIIYLLNHGVILTSDSLTELDTILQSVLGTFKEPYLPKGLLWKTSYPCLKEIRPLTPDILIYLGHRVADYEQIEMYRQEYQAEPKLVSYQNTLYIHSKTKKQYYDIKEVLEMYLELEKTATHTIDNGDDLLNWEREKYRQRI